jgi:sigma-B regulation protein RsbU (phosphoserine phosphatase)
MRYRTRLILLVTGLLAGAIIVLSALLAWSTQNALLASAEDSGRMVANLLARSAGLANEIPGEVEDMLGAQMVAEANSGALCGCGGEGGLHIGGNNPAFSPTC